VLQEVRLLIAPKGIGIKEKEWKAEEWKAEE
jgi:hypothetical protein